MAKVKNPLAVGNTGRGRASRRGGGSYDNPRENIDPHVKTHVLNTVEVLSNKIKLRDGTGAGFVKNDVNGVLSGGNTGGGGGSGSMTTVKEGGVQLGGADIVTLDFNGDDFNLTESPDTEVNVTVNDGGIDHTGIANIGSNTHAQIDTAVTASTNHIADNSQAHSDYLINNGDDTTSGKITANNMEIVGDNNTNDTSYMGMVLHGTDSSPPTASNYPHGTIYLQYAA